MIDLHSPSESLAIQMPTDLVSAIRELAQEKQITIDVVVREACLAYLEPYVWERCYKQWQRAHPDEPSAEFGGDELAPPKTEASPP